MGYPDDGFVSNEWKVLLVS